MKQDPAIEALMASGFPFQTAVAAVIQRRADWNLRLEEFPWEHPRTGDQFLDLVASCGRLILGIECKKIRKREVIFLKPSSAKTGVQRARCPYLFLNPDPKPHWELAIGDWMLAPSSVEATYCVQTLDKASGHILEPTAQAVTRGVLEYARREQRLKPADGVPLDPVYLSAIVTNAELFVARYDPRTVSLESGEFTADPEKEAVPYARFAKAFSATVDLGLQTVFVVRASELDGFLDSLSFLELQPRPEGRRRLP